MSRTMLQETGQQLDTAVTRTGQRAAHGLRDMTYEAAKEVAESRPVVVTETFLGNVAAAFRDMATCAWSMFIHFGHEHTRLSSAAAIWMFLSAVPLTVFAGFTAGLFLTSVGVAFAFVLPINGAVLLVSGSTLMFSLFVTTILSGFTYVWLYSVGLAFKVFKRIFPSTPAQRVDEGIASKHY